MKFSIRSALLAVAILSVVTCGLALFVFAHPLAAANTRRVERATDAVEGEVHRLHLAGPQPTSGSSGRGMTTRSGFVSAEDTFESLGLPWPEAPQALRDALAESRQTQRLVSDRRPAAQGVLFVAIEPAIAGRYAWAAYVMAPPRWTPVLRLVGIALGLTALALAVSAMFAVLVVRRGASALTRCLTALGRDLSTPVPRSGVVELNAVADGIADLARDLARTQGELAERERLAVLGRVTAGVAHELRNPLAVMKLRVDLMRRSASVPPEMTRELQVVVDEIVRLDRLVNDLLTIAGRRVGDQRAVDLAELARQRAELLAPLAAEKQIAIAVAGSAISLIDADAIGRVVDNLLRNAIEASPRASEIRVAVARDGGAARVRCEDRGSGVPPDRQAELFEPFFTTKVDGVGLGLALSRAIAIAHGGTLAYVRDRDVTIFELRLPGGL